MKKTQSVSKVKLVLAACGVITLVVMVVMGAMAVVNAAHPRGPSELSMDPAHQDEILAQRKALDWKEKLDLSDEQAAKVAEILLATRKEIGVVLRENAGDRMAIRATGRQRLEDVYEQVSAILNDEQRAKLDAMRDERRERIGQVLQMLNRNR